MSVYRLLSRYNLNPNDIYYTFKNIRSSRTWIILTRTILENTFDITRVTAIISAILEESFPKLTIECKKIKARKTTNKPIYVYPWLFNRKINDKITEEEFKKKTIKLMDGGPKHTMISLFDIYSYIIINPYSAINILYDKILTLVPKEALKRIIFYLGQYEYGLILYLCNFITYNYVMNKIIGEKSDFEMKKKKVPQLSIFQEHLKVVKRDLKPTGKYFSEEFIKTAEQTNIDKGEGVKLLSKYYSQHSEDWFGNLLQSIISTHHYQISLKEKLYNMNTNRVIKDNPICDYFMRYASNKVETLNCIFFKGDFLAFVSNKRIKELTDENEANSSIVDIPEFYKGSILEILVDFNTLYNCSIKQKNVQKVIPDSEYKYIAKKLNMSLGDPRSYLCANNVRKVLKLPTMNALLSVYFSTFYMLYVLPEDITRLIRIDLADTCYMMENINYLQMITLNIAWLFICGCSFYDKMFFRFPSDDVTVIYSWPVGFIREFKYYKQKILTDFSHVQLFGSYIKENFKDLIKIFNAWGNIILNNKDNLFSPDTKILLYERITYLLSLKNWF